MNNIFEFSVPQKIVIGEDSLKQLPDIFKKMNVRKVLLVSDHGIEKTALVKKIEDIFDYVGMACVSYLEVLPNPTIDMVNEALKAFQDFEAEGIVAVGGGSPMDVAKAVGVLSRYGGSISDYEGAHKVPGPITPCVAIPTTAGTGSEVTAFSVIVDTARHYKLTVFDYNLIPHYAILDPSVLTTAPASVAAACGIDAMIHAIEAYLSRSATPFSDAMAEKAMELIGKNIRRFVACREDGEAAYAMAVASNFAGIAFAWARLGNVHAMSHPVSAYFNVPHGVANAVLLPFILEYNQIADHDGRYEKIYRYICENPGTGVFKKEMLAEEVRKLNASLGIPARLADVGVTEDKISVMAEDAMKSGNIQANPRSSSLKDIIELYQTAL